MAITPNMSLDKPTPSVDIGPAWATRLNADLDLVDAHDHSVGKGTKVTPAGLNINVDLPMGGKRLTGSGGVVFQAVGTISNQQLYSDGTNLFYQDGAGVLMQLTKNGKNFIERVTGSWGAAASNITQISVNTVLVAAGTEYIIVVDMSGGAKQITLPAISTVPGRSYIFYEKTGTTNVLTVVPNGTDKINNVNANKTFNTAFSVTRVTADPTLVNWMVGV